MAPHHSYCFALAVLTLAGCATVDTGDYPSLARRSIELRVNAAAPSVEQPALPEPATADFATALAGLDGDATRGETAFRAALGAAEQAVAGARGSARESEAWVVAQIAISRLDAARAPSTLALAEVDRLVQARALAGEAAGAAELTALQTRVAALVTGQSAMLDRLLGGLAR
jgi:hypothetical protein